MNVTNKKEVIQFINAWKGKEAGGLAYFLAALNSLELWGNHPSYEHTNEGRRRLEGAKVLRKWLKRNFSQETIDKTQAAIASCC